jgi:hypothetical protein
MPAPAVGARSQLAYVKETVYGTTPTTPTTILLRTTGNSLELARATEESKELRSDRMITYVKLGNRNVKGSIDFELSYGTFDALLEGVTGGTWTSEAAGTPNTLKAGTGLESFSIEAGQLDIAQYQLFTGCVMDKLAVTMAAGKIVTAKLDVFGANMTRAGTSVCGAPTAAGTHNPMDTFTGVLKEGSSAIATVSALDFTLDNTAEPTPVMGTDVPSNVVMGRSKLTGTLKAYFVDGSLIDKYLASTATEIDITVKASASDTYTLNFKFANVLYLGAQAPVNTEKGLIVTLPFQALLDSGSGTEISITRSNP